MLKILTITALVVVAAIGIFLAYAATRPDRFQVQRSTSVRASAEKLFPLINELRAFNTWNPFDRKDPSIKGSYSGPASGKGAFYGFESAKAGTGSLEIIEATPPSKVIMRLLMSKPMAADNRVTFALEPQGDTTRVTWTIEGESPFIGKVMGVIFSMDKMIGGEFESGLADLKVLGEK